MPSGANAAPDGISLFRAKTAAARSAYPDSCRGQRQGRRMGMGNMENMKVWRIGEHGNGRVRISYAAGKPASGRAAKKRGLTFVEARPPACRTSDERLHDEWAGKERRKKARRQGKCLRARTQAPVTITRRRAVNAFSKRGLEKQCDLCDLHITF